jgi:2-C-methyl-D-erythritol 2,4-cyclodiphosphate synthase
MHKLPNLQHRVGLGFDIHRLSDSPGQSLALAGCLLPVDLIAEAHSDGDVVLHALIDAILGALALGDIGEWFPDTDEHYRGVDSAILLRTVLEDPRLDGWLLAQIDCNIIAERPRLAAHKAAMRQRLAELCHLPLTHIGLKARSHEQVDATGAGAAIQAQVIVQLVPDTASTGA